MPKLYLTRQIPGTFFFVSLLLTLAFSKYLSEGFSPAQPCVEEEAELSKTQHDRHWEWSPRRAPKRR